MVYLIGVNHFVQFGAPSRASNPKIVREKRASFKAHVLEVIETLGISLLAEEFSDEAKRIWKVSESILEQLANAKGIEHRFCDPTPAQRRENGIEQSDSDKREQFWLSRIQDCKSRNVLFVCGDDHVEAFSKKLTAVGFDVELAPNSWSISETEVFFSDR